MPLAAVKEGSDQGSLMGAEKTPPRVHKAMCPGAVFEISYDLAAVVDSVCDSSTRIGTGVIDCSEEAPRVHEAMCPAADVEERPYHLAAAIDSRDNGAETSCSAGVIDAGKRISIR